MLTVVPGDGSGHEGGKDSSSTSVTFGLLRHHGGKIGEQNRIRPPVTGSARLSFIRGAYTSITPATVVTGRGRACPLRTTSRRPFSSRSAA
jgi:hypothetical protein